MWWGITTFEIVRNIAMTVFAAVMAMACLVVFTLAIKTLFFED